MKKFIIKSLLTIVIPVWILLYAYEVSMRRIPNDYSYKSNYLNKNASNIQILVLGSSHCYYGINPTYFDLKAFNAAHVSQSYNYDWFIFDKYFDRMTSLNYVILPLSSFSPYGKLENGQERWRCLDYSVYYNCHFHKFYELKYRYYFSYISFGTLMNLVNDIYKNNSRIKVDSLGYCSRHEKVDDIVRNGREAAKRHTIKDIDKKVRLYEQNVAYILDIIKRCHDSKIKVVFVSTPTCPEYYSCLNNNQIDIMKDFGRKMEVYDNVKYINLFKSPLFDENDFYDSDHLCDRGAKKLTLIINDTINEWQRQDSVN